jgi:hypothetical protein
LIKRCGDAAQALGLCTLRLNWSRTWKALRRVHFYAVLLDLENDDAMVVTYIKQLAVQLRANDALVYLRGRMFELV